MSYRDRAIVIIVDDDADDCMMISRALKACAANNIVEINNGESLLTTLRECLERSEGRDAANLLVLLDINMPGIDGLETLAAMKADAALKHIPTIMLTTSDSPESVARSYDLGANAYVKKPNSYLDLQRAMEAISRFWFETVRIPPALRSA